MRTRSWRVERRDLEYKQGVLTEKLAAVSEQVRSQSEQLAAVSDQLKSASELLERKSEQLNSVSKQKAGTVHQRMYFGITKQLHFC